MLRRLSKGLIVMLLSSCAATANASLGQVQFANSCKPEVQARLQLAKEYAEKIRTEGAGMAVKL